MEIWPKKWGIFLPYCADWCARHALKPSAISKHFPVAWTLYSFHPLKHIQCRVYWEPSQGSCVAGFHTFLLGMYGWEQFHAWCGVIAGQFIRGAPASGKCLWASFFFLLNLEAGFFPGCCCWHSVAFVGNLFSSFMAVSNMCSFALLVWHVCKVKAPFVSCSLDGIHGAG